MCIRGDAWPAVVCIMLRLVNITCVIQVMPGLLLCFVLRYDAYKRSQPTSDVGVPAPPSVYQKLTYFHCSLIGYFLGKSCVLFASCDLGEVVCQFQ